MIDSTKIYEILKAKNDTDARDDIERLLALADETDLSTLVSVGYKPAANNGGMYSGYGSSATSSDLDLKDLSLFSYALFYNRYFSAACILNRLGAKVLLKSNEKKENGFHMVAKTENVAFRDWFLKESLALTMIQLDAQFRVAMNQITLAEQHVLTLLHHPKLTVNELRLWINLGANPTYAGVKPGNYLHWCCDKIRPDLVKFLIENNPQLMHIANDKGQLPIHLASSTDNLDLLILLTSAGSSLTVEDRLFNRPLHHAIVKGALPAIHYILRNQPYVLCGTKMTPYVNISNSSQETPLHLLLIYNKNYTEKAFQETLDILIAYGADISIMNDKGMTPVMLGRDLLKNDKLPQQYFNMVWLKLQEKYNPQLFTADSLFQLIQRSLSPAESQQIIHALMPILANQAPNPFHTITEDHTNSLRQLARTEYREQPQMVDPFLTMLDHLENVHITKQAVQPTNQPLNFQYQAQPPQPRGQNEMDMDRQMGYRQF